MLVVTRVTDSDNWQIRKHVLPNDKTRSARQRNCSRLRVDPAEMANTCLGHRVVLQKNHRPTLQRHAIGDPKKGRHRTILREAILDNGDVVVLNNQSTLGQAQTLAHESVLRNQKWRRVKRRGMNGHRHAVAHHVHLRSAGQGEQKKEEILVIRVRRALNRRVRVVQNVDDSVRWEPSGHEDGRVRHVVANNRNRACRQCS